LPSSLSNNQRGIAAILGCMASYTVNDVLVKQILQTYPVGEVIFVRGLMCSLLIGAMALAFGHAAQLCAPMSRVLASRSLCDGLATVAFIAALAHMKLANVAAVLQIAPLIITVLSVALYREAVGWRRWCAIGAGFFGALLVVKPIPSEFSIWAVAAAGSALFSATREIQNRQIGKAVPVFVIAFWGSVARIDSASASASRRWPPAASEWARTRIVSPRRGSGSGASRITGAAGAAAGAAARPALSTSATIERHCIRSREAANVASATMAAPSSRNATSPTIDRD